MAPQDWGKAINSAAFITMIAMVLAVCLHPGFKVLRERKLQLSEGLIVVAMIFGVARAICISRAVAYGLGQHIDVLSDSQVGNISDMIYTSEFLYVFAMVSARFATLAWVGQISKNKSHRATSSLLALLNLLWLLTAIFAVAFQCAGAPGGYTSLFSEKCINQVAFWSTLEAFAMLITLATIGNIVQVLWRLQMGKTRKFFIFIIFAARALEIPMDVLRLVFLGEAYNRATDTDPTYDSFAVVVTTEVFVNSAIILTTLPFLLKYIKQLSGTYTLEETERIPSSSRIATGWLWSSNGGLSSRNQKFYSAQSDRHNASQEQHDIPAMPRWENTSTPVLPSSAHSDVEAKSSTYYTYTS